MKGCLRKRGVDVRKARSMVNNRSEWREFMGCSPGDELLTLTRCHSYMKPVGGNLSVDEHTT